jgi:hypothetical protein
MINSTELEKLAIVATEKYLKDNIPLNDTIVKLAQDHGLNAHQVSRVVEAANTNVYVKLFNEAQNKYIEFPNADSEKIAMILNPPKNQSTVSASDYFLEPVQEKLREDTPIFKTGEDVVTLRESDALRDYYKLANLQERINNAVYELDALFETEMLQLKYQVKQAVLKGTAYDDIQSAVVTIFPDSFVKSAMKSLHKELSQEKLAGDKSTHIEQTHSVDTNHPIIVQVEKLLQIKQAYFNVLDKQAENMGKYEQLKTATAGTLISKVLQHPGVFTTGVGIGAVGGIAGYTKVKKLQAIQHSSPLQMTPSNYQRNQ